MEKGHCPIYRAHHHSSCKHVFSIRVENEVDPDQMGLPEASCSGSAVFSKKDNSALFKNIYLQVPSADFIS